LGWTKYGSEGNIKKNLSIAKRGIGLIKLKEELCKGGKEMSSGV